MAISDKLLQVNQVKQDIKTAIETKGIPMTNVAFTEYANKILEISGGGGGMTYEDYARTLYLAWGKSNQFATAWEHSLTVDPLEISANGSLSIQRGTPQYPNGKTEGVIIPQGVTSIGSHSFHNWTVNNQPLVIPNSVTSIGNSAFRNWTSNNQPLVIPNSVTSIGSQTFYDWSSNNHPLVIPNSVTTIGDDAFFRWSANNQPLVISDNVTSIGTNAFVYWSVNNHPLVIPNSITNIRDWSFGSWQSNKQPLVIPSSVISIGNHAFYNWSSVPYVEIKAVIPPTLVNSNAFSNQNNAPIYVPDASVDDYKTATNWVDLASRIFPVSSKP